MMELFIMAFIASILIVMNTESNDAIQAEKEMQEQKLKSFIK